MVRHIGCLTLVGLVGAMVGSALGQEPDLADYYGFQGLEMVKIGGNLLRSDSLPAPSTRANTGRVVQGHIENSAVDAVTLLKDLVGAAKSFGGNIKMMQYHDHIIGQAVNTLGRVA